MNDTLLYERLLQNIISGLDILPDKPEETAKSTLKALWLFASGIPLSAKIAKEQKLPAINESQVVHLEYLIKQRLNGVPLSHITGRQNFMGIEMISDSRALIPRKETEILGNKALEMLSEISDSNNFVNVIDVCCGSGNLVVALAKKFSGNARFYAADFSEEAVNLTRDNINFHNLSDRVEVRQGDLLAPFDSSGFFNRINLIVCNPPYISSFKVSNMNKEISLYEPKLAFDGGMMGFKIIQRLIKEASSYLTKEGWLIFEVGLGQGPFIIQLCEKSSSYSKVESVSDASGNIRVVLARK